MFEETSYQDVDFRDAQILEDTLSGIQFVRCRFDGADFSRIQLNGCRFENCRFHGTALNGMVAERCVFVNCSFLYANCFAAEFYDCKMTGSSFESASTTAIRIDCGDWRMTEMMEMDLSGEKISDINFSGASLRQCRFDKAVLRNCDFTGADIRGASFKNADLRGCTLDQLNLSLADFKGAKIDLTQAVAFAETFGVKVFP